MAPDIRTPKEKVEQDIFEFQRLVEDADIEFVGEDHDYVPDGPLAREGHPNVKDDETLEG